MFSKINSLSTPIFGLFVVAGLLTGCSRTMEDSGKLRFEIPSQSAQSTELLARVIINLRKDGQLVQKFTWVHPCESGDNNPQCQDGTIPSAAPPVYELQATQGETYLVQVLGVYLEDPANGETMIFRYDETNVFVQAGDNPVNLVLNKISTSNKEVRFIGKYVSGAAAEPTGVMQVSFQPPSGTFPMELFDEVIIGGWINVFGIDGAQFTYTLKSTGQAIIDRFDPAPGAQPSLTSEQPYRMRFTAADGYREDFDGGSSIPTYEAQEGGEVIVGFFGPYVEANPSEFAVCYQQQDAVTISGMFKDNTGSVGYTFDTVAPYDATGMYPSGTGGIGITVAGSCSLAAANNIEIVHSNYDGWLGSVAGFLSAYIDQTGLSTISNGGTEYLQVVSSTVISGGTQYDVDWVYIPGIFGTAINGTDIFVVDKNLKDQFRDTEYWDCSAMATQAIDYAGLNSYGNVNRFPTSTDNASGGEATLEIPQTWVDNSQAEGVICPYRLVAGSKEYLPAGIGNHGFYGNSSGCCSGGGPTPTNYYDFMTNSMPADFTFARGGGTTASYLLADGSMTVVGANVPRFNHDAYGNPLGILLESSSTNLISYSQAFDDAYFINSGVSIAADSSNDLRGWTTVDTVADITPTMSASIISSSIAITPGQKHVASVFVRKTGTPTAYPNFRINISGGAGQASYAQFNTQTCAVIYSVADSASGHDYNSFCRFEVMINDVGSNTSATVVFAPAWTTSGSGAASPSIAATNTLELWGLQLEQKSHASSYIPTSGTSQSRLSDLLYMAAATADARFASSSAGPGSFVISAENIGGDGSQQIFDWSQSGSQFIGLRYDPMASYNVITNGSGFLSGPASGSWSPGITRVFGVAYEDDNSSYAEDGSIVTTVGPTTTIPSISGTEFRIGNAGAGVFDLDGHVQFLKYYNWRLSNTDLMDATQ